MSSEHPGRAAMGRGAVLGLSAAALFGLSTPLSKLLLPSAKPIVLASLLYLGAGIGLSGVRLVKGPSPEARVSTADLPVLLAIILAGGVVGPILMLLGLERVSGISGSLLLNLEMPLTIVIATLFFGEHLERRSVGAVILIAAGAALLGYGPGGGRSDWIGTLAIAGACLSWALDNNLTQRLSLRDPITVTQIKTLGAGLCTALIAGASGGSLPAGKLVLAALALGSVSYGLSLVLNMRALRLLGAARQAAYFATAPFAGALLSIPLLGDPLKATVACAAALMLGGVALLLRERHGHVHTHREIEHDHLHVHDEHHRHAHDGPFEEPHAHPHRHEQLTHDHPHVSDLHHRHRH